MAVKCEWCLGDPLYEEYHDKEWGKPLHDDEKLFEMLVLETFQAGLSWFTILKKRENFRQAFDRFDAVKIANYNMDKVEELLKNKGIIRNRLKITSMINNAKIFLAIQKESGSFDKYIWSFTNYKPVINKFKKITDIPAKTELSDIISRDMKKKGFKFVGSVSVYAFLQSIGIVNDHVTSCFRYKELVNQNETRG